MSKIKQIKAREILDSRGNPTVEVKIVLDNGSVGIASVPSGASTGRNEAIEIRDRDSRRYNGLGILKAVQNINEVIVKALLGKSSTNQKAIDRLLIDLDGTENKSILGANAILGVSLAVCKGAANSKNLPLYKYISKHLALSTEHLALPVPMFNIINGGKHGDNNLDIQEFMVAPKGLKSFSKMLQAGSEIFHKLKEVLQNKNLGSDIGDEGGFAPNLETNAKACEVILEAILKAGYVAGKDIYLALDIAATGLFRDNKYVLSAEGTSLNSIQMIGLYNEWAIKYPIISIEDGLCEDDWANWRELTRKLGNKIKIIGDDLFVTNPQKLQKGISEKAANGIIIKPNQIGTLTETLEVIKMAKDSGYTIVVSHRSGETNDSFIADLAVAAGADYIKAGAPCRGERLAKYNRLLAIEEELS
jgi:enolase